MIHTLLRFALLLTFLAVTGCTSIRPQFDPLRSEEVDVFSYQGYAELLQEIVDDDGWVDYQQLVAAPEKLEEFYGQLSRYSPDSHPGLFPTPEARLAYWLNAYNGTVLKGVLEYYPMAGVAAVQAPALLFFFPEKSGFFFFQRFTYGGVETSLYYLENSVIRKRFAEPRIHFALNCASRSCPRLPQHPFYPEQLEEHLEHETHRFINDPTRVRYDANEKILYLSKIFDWYRDDFITWQRARGVPKSEQTLQHYVLPYLEGDAGALLASDLESVILVFLEYDWGLNDRALAESAERAPAQ